MCYFLLHSFLEFFYRCLGWFHLRTSYWKNHFLKFFWYFLWIIINFHSTNVFFWNFHLILQYCQYFHKIHHWYMLISYISSMVPKISISRLSSTCKHMMNMCSPPLRALLIENLPNTDTWLNFLCYYLYVCFNPCI